MATQYTVEEVAQHNKETDCWLIIGNDSNGGSKVYDVTKYLNDHPGGPEILLEVAGKDADDMFEDMGHSKEAREHLKGLLVGELKVDPNAPKKSKKKAAEEIKSKGGLNPMAVLALLFAVAVGLYFSSR